MSKQNKRSLKNLFIDRQFQLRYMSMLFGTGLVLIICYTAVFYFYTQENYSTLVNLSPMTDEARNQLYQELYEIVGILVGSSVVFLAAMTFLGLYISHKAAGPMQQFKRVFGEVGNGNLQARIKLRKDDDFKEVADAFNAMVERLGGRK